ncbi:hypothetical protein OEW28_18630 [Defluviimonas sp. WL0002]|uniref:Bacteriophage tail tape measure C-terminal domain-containing protein n=1 Tax=Albidovulum marisflavi TaxID=2984159 RepID=A0ABT2ZHW5_9RHOB|nr:hypothetical protein [Defluviimonas sp. WL0002]MCV2870633.1 hypothetical protein [Defluviimonas sp. WL0002]
MAEKRVSVKFQAVGADKMKAEFTEIGREGKRAFDGVRDSSARMGPQLQNAAFQVGDFFVQVSSGTSATRALAQQLPQLLGGFGLFGALAGAGVAALAALIPAIFGTGEEAKDLDDKMQDLEKSMTAYVKATKEARTPIGELRQDYSDLADEILRLREIQAAVDTARASKSIGSSADAIANEALQGDTRINSAVGVAALEVGLDALIEKGDILREKLQLAEPLSEAEAEIRRQIEVNDAYIATLSRVQDGVSDLAEEWGVSAEAAQRVAEAAARLREAPVDETAEAARKFADELISVFGSAEAVDAIFPQMLDKLNDLVQASADFAANLGTAAVNAAEAQRLAQAAYDRGNKQYGGRGGDPRQFMSDGAKPFVYEGPALDENNNVRVTTKGGGKANAGLAEAQRLYEATRSSAEKYAQEVERINELHRLFPDIVTQDVVDRGLRELQEQLGRTDGMAQRAASAIQTAFTGLFDDPKEALRQLGEQLLQMALFKQLAMSFPGTFGAGGVIPLPSFDGGGFTGTGTRSGGLDGKGGYLAMLHPNETVTDHTKGGGMGGTSVVVQNYSGAPARAERSQGPDGREMVRVIVGEQMARGNYDKSMQGRYGARPNPVKR